MRCMHCDTELEHVFADLGNMPVANVYETCAKKAQNSKRFPLRAFVCEGCFLVQCEQHQSHTDLFAPDYAYFASVSSTWLEHARAYCTEIVDELCLSTESTICEIASNDGYLLRNFVNTNMKFFGVEPTSKTAEHAKSLGIDVVESFFSLEVAKELVLARGHCDLIIANNVLAHVPDINDFVRGLKELLSDRGTITVEFQHLLNIITEQQFDTIYHEHFSYLSLLSVTKILKRFGLRPYKATQLSTHGGSLRLYICHDHDEKNIDESIFHILSIEKSAGLTRLETYTSFQEGIESTIAGFLDFMGEAKKTGKVVQAYGAAAKGNTFLNFAGMTVVDIGVIYDAAPSKQGKYLSGSGIEIKSPEELEHEKVDYMLILPWNLAPEITRQLKSQHGNQMICFSAVPRISFHG